MAMTGKERFLRQLDHKSVDRISSYEQFWTLTKQTWIEQGFVKKDELLEEHFDFDLENAWVFNRQIQPDFVPEILEEDEDTKVILDGNYAKLRMHKKHASTPEHIGYAINNYADYLEIAREALVPSEDRINFEQYRTVKERCERTNRAFCWAGVSVFESMHPIAGHENMLMGMALEPEWIEDMVDRYVNLYIGLYEILFEKEGKPDFLWFFEDMGFRGRPFMSPEMYKELILPGHKRLADFAHGHGLKVVMHSCGFIEPLLPHLIGSGSIDCLQAMEVKAGMDLLRIYKNYGEKVALMGGLDVRPIIANDKAAMKEMLETHIPIVKANNGYILHSDHSIPENTPYEAYKYFLDLGRELGKY